MALKTADLATIIGSSRASDPSMVADLTDTDLVNHVKQLFYRARAARRPLVKQWVKNYNVVRNRTWGNNRQDWMPSPEVPEIYPIIAAIVAWETDQRPSFDVTPSQPMFSGPVQFYEQLAQDLTTVLDTIWTVYQYDGEVEKVIWDSQMYGVGIFKSIWDPGANGGMGDPIMTRVDPFTFYVDPDATCMTDALYCMEVKTLSLQELERRFPGAIDKLGGHGYSEGNIDAAPKQTDGAASSRPKANPGAIAPNTIPRYGLPGQTDRLTATEDPGVTVWEAWLKTPITPSQEDQSRAQDPTNQLGNGDSDDVNEEAKSGNETDTADNADDDALHVYQGWRCVVIASNHVLMDEPVENLWSHGEHPYSRFVPHDTGEFYGMSMVEMLTPAQVSVNRLLAAIEQNIWLIGNPVFVEDRRAGTQRTRITNKPGTRITTNDGGKVEWLTPPIIHPQMSSELIKFYIAEMERISGLSAIVRGATPTGRNSQGVLDSVQEAAFVRIRMSLRNLERALRDAGNKIASLVTEFYDEPRVVAMVGDSGQQTSLAILGKHFYLPAGEDGREPMKFQLLISSGSMLPTAHSQRAAEADTLYAMGAIDDEAVLEAHNWPNRWAIVARQREMKAQAGTLGQPPGARAAAGRTH